MVLTDGLQSIHTTTTTTIKTTTTVVTNKLSHADVHTLTTSTTKEGAEGAHLLLGLPIALSDQFSCRQRGGVLLVDDAQCPQAQPELQCTEKHGYSQHTSSLGRQRANLTLEVVVHLYTNTYMRIIRKSRDVESRTNLAMLLH